MAKESFWVKLKELSFNDFSELAKNIEDNSTDE